MPSVGSRAAAVVPRRAANSGLRLVLRRHRRVHRPVPGRAGDLRAVVSTAVSNGGDGADLSCGPEWIRGRTDFKTNGNEARDQQQQREQLQGQQQQEGQEKQRSHLRRLVLRRRRRVLRGVPDRSTAGIY